MRVQAVAAAAVLAFVMAVAMAAPPAFADGIERAKPRLKSKPRATPRPQPELLGGPEALAPQPLPLAIEAEGLVLDNAFFQGGGGVGYGLGGGSGCGCGGGRVVIVGRHAKSGFGRGA